MLCNQAIPTGTLENHTPAEYRWSVAQRLACVVLCLAFLFTGCNKKSGMALPTLPVLGQTGPAPVVQKGDGASGRNTILQMPFDNVAKLVLLNIGRAYQMASISENRPPKNAEEAGLEPRNLKTKRDMQDHEVEVLYGVDVKKLGDEPGKYAIAWEKMPTNDGYRMVLMADFTTVKYVSTEEFEKMPRAKK